MIENVGHICIKMFADDTNAIMEENARTIAKLWKCLCIYCTASSLVINHAKFGLRRSIQNPILWLMEEGCKTIPDAEIVRNSGIPMGFNVSIKKC